MMLLMRTNSSDGDFSGNCDLAIVDLDSEYCRRIIERLQFFREAQNHGDGGSPRDGLR